MSRAELLRSSVRLLHVLTEVDCAAIMTSGHVPRRTADGMPTTYRERKRYAWQLLREQAEIYLETPRLCLMNCFPLSLIRLRHPRRPADRAISHAAPPGSRSTRSERLDHGICRPLKGSNRQMTRASTGRPPPRSYARE